MAGSFWQSSDHCRFRAREEVAKALDAAPVVLRVQHLENALAWFARARRAPET